MIKNFVRKLTSKQNKDIMYAKIFIRLHQRYERMLPKVPLNYLQRHLLKHHAILPRGIYYQEVLKMLGRSPKRNLSSYKDELLNNTLLHRNYIAALEQGKITKKYKQYKDRFASEANIVNYYAVAREIEPDIVVETGTAAGFMTSWVLAALEANGKGRLISIDIPPVQGKLGMGMSVNKEEIGFLIPREYHNRWEYICADAKIMLPKVLADNPTDIFIHDSLHTRTHMLFEYNVARCLMRPNSLILSDDILCNKAFFNFLQSHNLTGLGCISNPNLGLTVNRFDEYELRIGTDIIRHT